MDKQNSIDYYPCKTPGCKNMVRFSTNDEEKFRSLGFLNDDGTVSKPKYCYDCRQKRKANTKK